MEPFYPALALTGAVFLVFGMMSRPLRGGLLTAPMLAVAAGIAASLLFGLHEEIRLDSPVIGAIGEVALAIVLFTDASGVDLKRLRRDWALPARLLAVGLPLTMLAGALVGRLVLPDVPWAWLVAVAVILAPTDAALGIATLLDESVPQRVRDALNVESGLNDGVALPVLIAVLASLAAPASAVSDIRWIATAAADIAIGAVLGSAFGIVGGRIIGAAWKREWIDETYARLVSPGLAILTFTAAHLLDKNGFVAAYFAGLTLAVRSEDLRERVRNFGEADGTQFSLLVFLLFGMVVVPATWSHWTPAVLAYALLSLTVARMLPVALGLAGTRLGAPTVLFVGWSGPRGIASVLYLAMVAQQFPQRPAAVDAAIALTVLLSVALHGLSAAPLAAAYGRRCAVGQAGDAKSSSAG